MMKSMKPIPFCHFGGYRRFCSRWWNDLSDYLFGVDFSEPMFYREIEQRRIRFRMPGWLRDILTYWHRARYGWAPRDTWSLDDYLNRVIGHSLAHLAEHAHGAPSGYPLGNDAPLDSDGCPETNFAQWEADLTRWSQAFLDLERTQDVVSHDRSVEAIRARWDAERAAYRKVEQTLREMGPWWGSLWD